jgi:hypothetical protein
MTQNNEALESAIAGTLETLGEDGTVYRNGVTSAIILLEDRIVTVNADGSTYEAALGEWNLIQE